MVWEEKDDYWDGLPLDWASDGAFGEEAMAIWDAMEEDFQRDKMIARQKFKGKRELLNLHSSINYGDTKDPFRRRKGKHTWCRLMCLGGWWVALYLSWALL